LWPYRGHGINRTYALDDRTFEIPSSSSDSSSD
jgi:hypothetical protein